MIVLVDTSVWAEYFRKRPRLDARQLDHLDELIREDLVVIVQPVRAELLSGRLEKERETVVREALAALRSVDLDWNAAETWDENAACARKAREDGVSSAGLVDRMVLLAAERAGGALWTLDRPLRSLARSRGTSIVA